MSPDIALAKSPSFENSYLGDSGTQEGKNLGTKELVLRTWDLVSWEHAPQSCKKTTLFLSPHKENISACVELRSREEMGGGLVLSDSLQSSQIHFHMLSI